jgi:copper chaperone CopZ
MASMTLTIQGMSCGHCVARVEKALAAVPGVSVRSVQVGRADLEVDQPAEREAAVLDSIAKAGYRPEVVGR